MLRWVILSVVVVVLAAAATLVAQYRDGLEPVLGSAGRQARKRDLSLWSRSRDR